MLRGKDKSNNHKMNTHFGTIFLTKRRSFWDGGSNYFSTLTHHWGIHQYINKIVVALLIIFNSWLHSLQNYGAEFTLFFLLLVRFFVIDSWNWSIKNGYCWTMGHKIISWNDSSEERLVSRHVRLYIFQYVLLKF